MPRQKLSEAEKRKRLLARLKEYRSRPEVKAAAKKYNAARRKDPKIRAAAAAYARARYQKLKAAKAPKPKKTKAPKVKVAPVAAPAPDVETVLQ